VVSNYRQWVDDLPGPDSTCPSCLDPDPNVRYGHLLILARTESFEAIERHSWENLRRTKLETEDIRRYVEARLEWVRDQVTAYSGLVDPQTGAKLTWWEGRRQTIEAVRAATERMKREADTARQARDVRGFSRVQPTVPSTPIPEPTERDAALWEQDMAMAGAVANDYTDELEED
jgi:hypothetical protein